MNDLECKVFKEELEKLMSGLGQQIGSVLGELLANEIRARELKDKLDINDVENKGRRKI